MVNAAAANAQRGERIRRARPKISSGKRAPISGNTAFSTSRPGSPERKLSSAGSTVTLSIPPYASPGCAACQIPDTIVWSRLSYSAAISEPAARLPRREYDHIIASPIE
jgi:hypothetical protein